MRYYTYALFLFMTFVITCGYKGGPYDPESPDYEKPSFSIDGPSSTIAAANDTVTADSATLTLIGNDDHRRNQFRFSLDSAAWTPWGGDGEAAYVIRLTGLSYGNHSLRIEVCYHPDNDDIADSAITFYRAQIPEISAMVDTSLATRFGSACTLWVQAEGTGTLHYQWLRNTTLLEAAVSETLMIGSVAPGDTAAAWFCRVNSTWGTVLSPAVRLHGMCLLTFDGNGNTGGEPPPDTTITPGADVRAPGNPGNLVRKGYSFAGWNTADDSSGKTENRFWIDFPRVTLYAIWKKNRYPLSYDGNGSSCGDVPADTTCYYGDPVPAALQGTLARTGYMFAGWDTVADGSGMELGEGEIFTMTAEPVTLYAQWREPDGMTVIRARDVTFRMGKTPSHPVRFSSDFWMDTTEVTQKRFANHMRKYMSYYTAWAACGTDSNCPAVYVTWFDAVLYCNARTLATNSKDTVYSYSGQPTFTPGFGCTGLTNLVTDLKKEGFHLPTEAQWEFAYHAGTTSDYYWGDDTLTEYTVVGAAALPVGSKKPNDFRLYDMSGNVWEWVNDLFGAYTTDTVAVVIDPEGASTGTTNRILRGGGYTDPVANLTGFHRLSFVTVPNPVLPNAGFRVCLPAR